MACVHKLVRKNILQVLLYTVCLVYVLCIMVFFLFVSVYVYTYIISYYLPVFLYIKKRWVQFLYVTIKIQCDYNKFHFSYHRIKQRLE